MSLSIYTFNFCSLNRVPLWALSNHSENPLTYIGPDYDTKSHQSSHTGTKSRVQLFFKKLIKIIFVLIFHMFKLDIVLEQKIRVKKLRIYCFILDWASFRSNNFTKILITIHV